MDKKNTQKKSSFPTRDTPSSHGPNTPPFLGTVDASQENFAYLRRCLPEAEPAWPLPWRRNWQRNWCGSGGSRAGSQVNSSRGSRPCLVPIYTRHGATSPGPHCARPHTAPCRSPSLRGLSQPPCASQPRWAQRSPTLKPKLGGSRVPLAPGASAEKEGREGSFPESLPPQCLAGGMPRLSLPLWVAQESWAYDAFQGPHPPPPGLPLTW